MVNRRARAHTRALPLIRGSRAAASAAHFVVAGVFGVLLRREERYRSRCVRLFERLFNSILRGASKVAHTCTRVEISVFDNVTMYIINNLFLKR